MNPIWLSAVTADTRHMTMEQLTAALNDSNIKCFIYARGHVMHARNVGFKDKHWGELERVCNLLHEAATEQRPICYLTQRRTELVDANCWDYICTKSD